MANQPPAVTETELRDVAARIKSAGFTVETIGRVKLSELVGVGDRRAQTLLAKLRAGIPRSDGRVLSIQDPDLTVLVRDALRKRKGRATLEQVCDALDRSPGSVRSALDALKAQGYNVALREGACELSGDVQPGAPSSIVHPLADFTQRWRTFGTCGDKHLGNRQARIDVMESLYDIYADEGITEVYDTGNWIDGECSFNKSELVVFGLDAQIDYWIDKHPQRKGITTYFVAGDDHEGWYQKRECIEIGRYAELRAERAGRTDLKYIGYLESDIELKAESGSAWMKVMHPGGGSAYALSYSGQKMAEAFQGGEKPAVLIMGHYHKANFGFPREIYTVDTGTCCDQTVFMRKKRIQAHVGGWIVRMNQSPDGAINRFSAEFIHYFDRGYYTGKLRKFGVAA